MTIGQETISRFSSATKKMKKLTEPLASKGIMHFSMIRSYDDGRFVNLSNIDGWVDYYYQQKLYLSSCFEDHPSEYFSQVFLWRDKLDGDVIEDAKKHFDSSNGVTVIDRSFNYTSFYFFSSSLEKTQLDNFYINNLPFLHQFINMFEKEAASLIRSCISDKRHHIYDELYVNNPLPDNIRSSEKITLKDIKQLMANRANSEIDFPKITPKEAECLSLLLKGLSIKEIAAIKHLSPRTVEHHINSLKDKFMCKTSLNLVSSVYTKHYHFALSLVHANYE